MEVSYLWETNTKGDGAVTGYTEAQTLSMWSAMWGDGVLPGSGNDLAPTVGTGRSIDIAAGWAVLQGNLYTNTTTINIPLPATTIGSSTGHRVVLRRDPNTKQVRLALISSSNGVASFPSITVIPGGIYEMLLANVTVGSSGTVTINTDARVFAQDVQSIRQGGSPTDWNIAGTTIYRLGQYVTQFGVASILVNDINDEVGTTVAFPNTFVSKPHILLSLDLDIGSRPAGQSNMPFFISSIGTSSFTIGVYNQYADWVGKSVKVHWEAKGRI